MGWTMEKWAGPPPGPDPNRDWDLWFQSCSFPEPSLPVDSSYLHLPSACLRWSRNELCMHMTKLAWFRLTSRRSFPPPVLGHLGQIRLWQLLANTSWQLWLWAWLSLPYCRRQMPSEFHMHLKKLAHMRKYTHEPRDHLYIDMGIGLTVSIQIS